MKTVQEISMHHAFINRVELEKEADSLLAKMVLWARRGGSQQAPFSPMLQCRLGQTLALVATERPHTLKTIIPALNYLLQGGQSKGDICAQMTAVGRQHLSVGILRLLRIAPKYLSNQGPEYEQLLQLRQAINVLDDSTSSKTDSSSSTTTAPASSLSGNNVVTLLSGVHSSDPRKRKLEEMAAAAAVQAQQKADSLKREEAKSVSTDARRGTVQSQYEGYEDGDGEDSDDEMGLDEESIRQNAVSAVEAHMSQSEARLSKRAKIDDLLDHLTGTDSSVPPAASGVSLTAPLTTSTSSLASSLSASTHTTTTHSNITSLASDLGDFPKTYVGNSLRLVSLLPSGSGSVSLLQSIPPPAEVYSDLSLGSLSKLINQTICIKKNSILPQDSYSLKFSHVSFLSSCLELKLVMRMIFSMSARDVDQHRAYLQLMSSKAIGSATVSRPTIQHVALLKSRGQHASLLSTAAVKEGGGSRRPGGQLTTVPKDVLLPR
jgi:hypothetical protein